MVSDDRRLGRYDSDDPTTQKNIHTAVDLLLDLDPHRALARVQGHPDVDRLYNMIQFTLLWQVDLLCLLDELRVRRSGWKRKLFGRHVALVGYEAMKDSKAFLDFQLREILTGYGRLDELEGRLRSVHSSLERLRKGQEEKLGDLRNYTVAHRDEDAAAQLDRLRKLDTKAMARFGEELLAWLTQLYNFLSDSVQAITAEIETRRSAS